MQTLGTKNRWHLTLMPMSLEAQTLTRCLKIFLIFTKVMVWKCWRLKYNFLDPSNPFDDQPWFEVNIYRAYETFYGGITLFSHVGMLFMTHNFFLNLLISSEDHFQQHELTSWISKCHIHVENLLGSKEDPKMTIGWTL